METVEVSINKEQMVFLTDFLQANSFQYSLSHKEENKEKEKEKEKLFYESIQKGMYEYIRPSKGFSRICGTENLSKDGKMCVKDMYKYICFQETNPNFPFLDKLKETVEYHHFQSAHANKN